MSAATLFDGTLQERYDDLEVKEGKIALVATNKQLVQKPPNCLDRMRTRKQKQVAYNERVLKAEDKIAGIHCEIADFLSDMNAVKVIIVCVNAGATMKRNKTVLGGQLWQEQGRSMTAVNGTIDGVPNTRESAILAAAVEAVEWKHPIEPVSDDGKRLGLRVVIYPAEMPQLEEAMNEFSQNPAELEDGSHIAYSKILEKCAEYETSPRFYGEDSDEIRSNPELAAAVPLWMNVAAQVSVGSRDLVLENGPDVMNSSDEESPTEEHGEKLEGMYVGGIKAPVLLSQSEVARQKAAATALKRVLPRSQSPSLNSPERVESSGSDLKRSKSSSSLPAPPKGGTEVETSGSRDSSESPPAPPKGKGKGKKGSGKKAATRPAGSSMVTRSQDACVAGGTRGVTGSGQTDACVPQRHPSKT
jgi:hypothetical protein